MMMHDDDDNDEDDDKDIQVRKITYTSSGYAFSFLLLFHSEHFSLGVSQWILSERLIRINHVSFFRVSFLCLSSFTLVDTDTNMV